MHSPFSFCRRTFSDPTYSQDAPPKKDCRKPEIRIIIGNRITTAVYCVRIFFQRKKYSWRPQPRNTHVNCQLSPLNAKLLYHTLTRCEANDRDEKFRGRFSVYGQSAAYPKKIRETISLRRGNSVQGNGNKPPPFLT